MAVSKNSPRSPQAATPTRMESDSFGPIEVAADRYWGAQTERSRRNFRIGEERMPLPLVKALAMVKKAAALANLELGLIDERLARAIVAAADEVIEGRHDAHFPLLVWQTGSGTQSNMNLNEVIANRASELLGGKLGREAPDPSQRSRQSRPVVQRHLSHRHAYRRGGRARLSAEPGARPPRSGAQGQGGGVPGHPQDRPDPFAGRDTAHPWSGIRRIFDASVARHGADQAGPLRALPARPRRHRRRHRAECASRSFPSCSPPRSPR